MTALEERTFVQLEKLAGERGSSVEDLASQTLRSSLEQAAEEKMQREMLKAEARLPYY